MSNLDQAKLLVPLFFALSFLSATACLQVPPSQARPPLKGAVNQLELLPFSRIHQSPGGQLLMEVTDTTIVELVALVQEWAEVRTADWSGYTRLQNLPRPGILIPPTNFRTAPTSFLQVQLTTGHPSSISFLLGEQFLLKAPLQPEDALAEIRYALYFTGNPHWPFLFFYSGQHGQGTSVPGQLIFCHPSHRDFTSIQLNRGTGVQHNWLHLTDGQLQVKEAFLCDFPQKTIFDLSADPIHPKWAVFFERDQLISAPSENAAILTSDLVLFQDTMSSPQQQFPFKRGTPIYLEILRYERYKRIVEVRINGQQGWLFIDTLLTLPIMQQVVHCLAN